MCLHLVCVLDTLPGKDCNKFGHSAELVLKFTHVETHMHTHAICHRQCVGVRAGVIDS